MTMRYASLPPSSDVERAEAQRATRNMHRAVGHIERLLGDRSFRMWTLVTLNALDLLTTAAVLALGGSEANPAMAGVVEHWWKPIIVKAVVLALMWMVVLRAPVRSRVSAVVLALAWVFYAFVVGWNTLLLINH